MCLCRVSWSKCSAFPASVISRKWMMLSPSRRGREQSGLGRARYPRPHRPRASVGAHRSRHTRPGGQQMLPGRPQPGTMANGPKAPNSGTGPPRHDVGLRLERIRIQPQETVGRADEERAAVAGERQASKVFACEDGSGGLIRLQTPKPVVQRTDSASFFVSKRPVLIVAASTCQSWIGSLPRKWTARPPPTTMTSSSSPAASSLAPAT